MCIEPKVLQFYSLRKKDKILKFRKIDKKDKNKIRANKLMNYRKDD